MKTLFSTRVLIALFLLVFPIAGLAQGVLRAEGRYFAGESGELFMIVGHNEGYMWPYIEELWTLPPEQSDKVVADYFAELAANGVNTIRVFAEYPSEGIYLQEPDGTLVEETWRRLERLAYLADRYGIYLLVGPWDPFWTERNWEADPLNAANGGPMEVLGDFYRSEKAREHQRIRLKALIDRLGGRRNILAWEILNEADLWWEPEPQLVESWFTEMAEFMADYETQRWGRRHMIGLSAGDPIPSPVWRPLFYETPRADFVSTHLYVNAIADPFSAVEAARQMHDAMVVQIEIIGKNPRPYLETENGPIEPFVIREGQLVPPELDNRVYAAICWPHVIVGGAGQPLRWPYLIPHTMNDEMQRVQIIQGRFFDRFKFADYDPYSITARTSIEDPVSFVSAAADGNQLIASVVFDEKPHASKWEVTLAHRLMEDEYRIEWLDAWSGEILQAESRRIAADEPLTLSAPEANRHLIISLQPTSWAKTTDPKAPTPQVKVAVRVEEQSASSKIVRYDFYNPKWGRETYNVPTDKELEVTLPIGDWRVRAYVDGYLPTEETFAADRLNNVLEISLAKSALKLGNGIAYASEFESEEGLSFWEKATIEGDECASLSVKDGTLSIVNTLGSRSGAMSPRFRLEEGDRVVFEGVLESYDGHNALVCLYGGDGDFDQFMELEVSRDVLKLWASVRTETRRFIPATVRPPVHIRCEVQRDADGVHICFIYNEAKILEMKDVRSLENVKDLAVFLYGWDAKNNWSFVRIEGIIAQKTKESFSND